MVTLEEMRYLKNFQVRRLQDTYRDFVELPMYQPAGKFFFEELYGPKNHQDRDQSFEKLHHHLSGKFGAQLIKDMGRLIELNQLSNILDQKLYEKIVERYGIKEFNLEEYCAAYLVCDNYEERVAQINGIDYAVGTFYHLAQRPMVGFLLKSISLTAKVVGAHSMVDFLRGGYEAFRCIPDITSFQKALKDREFEFLNQIYKKN